MKIIETTGPTASADTQGMCLFVYALNSVTFTVHTLINCCHMGRNFSDMTRITLSYFPDMKRNKPSVLKSEDDDAELV